MPDRQRPRSEHRQRQVMLALRVNPEDLLSIVHTFSCRLCGLRRYEKALKDELGGSR